MPAWRWQWRWGVRTHECAYVQASACRTGQKNVVGYFFELLKRRRGRRWQPEGYAGKEVRSASPTTGRCSSTAALAAVTVYMAKVEGRSVVAAWNIPALTAKSASITLAVNGPQVRSTALLANSPGDAILRAFKVSSAAQNSLLGSELLCRR